MIRHRNLSLRTVLVILPLLIVISVLITYFFVGNELFTEFPEHIDGIIYGFLVGLTFWLGNTILGWYNIFARNKINC